MSDKLSYKMRSTLNRLKNAGEKGLRVSNTNATLHALQKRGLVEAKRTPEASKSLCYDWVITEAGKAVI